MEQAKAKVTWVHISWFREGSEELQAMGSEEQEESA